MSNKRPGRKSLSQTPSPKKDRIRGSKVNKKGSAASSKSASSIKFAERTLTTIKNKVKEYNSKNPTKKINVNTAKAYRPTIKGGKPNSRTAWGLARLNAFMRKKSKSKTANGVVSSSVIKKAYVQDNDLLKK
jgi:hypothetical protein